MDKITVLDFGCQYTHQLGEGIRRVGVYSEIVPHNTPFPQISDSKGLILSGGPRSVYEVGSPKCDRRVFERGIPVLGVCYGAQLMDQELGGKVTNDGTGEYGRGRVRILKDSRLFKGLEREETVWFSHGDCIAEVPSGFEVLARSNRDLIAAISNEERNLYAVLFHPEVSHTEKGDQVLRNYAIDICGVKPEWNTDDYVDHAIEEIRRQVGDSEIHIFTSGGVDSSVAAMLIYRALGRLNAYYVDNGFGRKGEAEQVRDMLGYAGINLNIIDARDMTLRKLGRTVDPEKKRNIIGDAFIEALYAEISGFRDNPRAYLGQGSIYPDFIESGQGIGKIAAVIKTHHNTATKLIKLLRKAGRVVEPNRRLFKYEVREIARKLGLPAEISERHPFPGPGLGVRYVGRVLRPDEGTQDAVSRILAEYGLQGVVAPVGTVGVKGSHRAYGSVVLIKGNLDQYETVREVSNRLGNEVPRITKAALVLDGRDFSQGEWNGIRRMHITSKRLDMLRDADHIAMRNLRDHGLYENVSQMPVVLFPGPDNMPWIAYRPGITRDFMTVRTPNIPDEMTREYFEETTQEIMRAIPVGGVVLDTTNKPPGPMEWE